MYPRRASARTSITTPTHFHNNRALPDFSNFISLEAGRIGMGRQRMLMTLLGGELGSEAGVDSPAPTILD